MKSSLLVFLCSHQMQAFFLIGHAMEVVFIGALILAIVWSYQASVPREMVKIYPWSVRFHMSLPFNGRWIDEVASEHVVHIRKFRRANFSVVLVLMVFGLWTVAYGDLLGPRLLQMMAGGKCG